MGYAAVHRRRARHQRAARAAATDPRPQRAALDHEPPARTGRTACAWPRSASLAPPDPLRSRDDATLAGLAAVGDRDALEVLLDRHVDRVHAICRRVLGNPDDALDASQEALIAVARGDPPLRRAGRVHHLAPPRRDQRGDRRAAPPPTPADPRRPGVRRRGAGALAHVAPGAGPEAIGDRIDIDAALARIPEEFRGRGGAARPLRPRLRPDRRRARRSRRARCAPGSRGAGPRSRSSSPTLVREPARPGPSSNGRPTMTQPPPPPAHRPVRRRHRRSAQRAPRRRARRVRRRPRSRPRPKPATALEQWPEYPARLAALEHGARRGRRTGPAARRPHPAPARPHRAPRRGRHRSHRRSVRGWSWLRISAAAAAALIVLAGLGAMLTSLGTGDGSDSAKSSSAGSAAAAEAAAAATWATSVTSAIPRPSATSSTRPRSRRPPRTTGGARAAGSSTRGSATTGGIGRGLDPVRCRLPRRFDAPIDPRACAGRLAGTRPVRFFATGTYQGQPVTIVGIESGGRTIAFVVSSNDCTNVLTAISR